MVAAPPFARANGGEFGVRTVAVRGLQTTATLWYLGFDSELIYVGDSGSTEEGPASRRMGLEITNYIYPNRWTSIDLDLQLDGYNDDSEYSYKQLKAEFAKNDAKADAKAQEAEDR